MRLITFTPHPTHARAEEIARYDALLLGACGEPYLQLLQTLARVFDVDPADLSPKVLWDRLRPYITGEETA